MENLLEIESLHCQYQSHTVLDDVSLQVKAGQSACLLGPSGCGKTTLLRVIAGFERASRGSVKLAGQYVEGKGVYLPPEQRGIGMVFQDHALFPHLTVWQNTCFGLGRCVDNDEVMQLLALLELDGFEQRYPHQLSGGQQQRVALARALAPKPRLLLLDEPFSNLDVHLRQRLAVDLRLQLQRQGVTTVMVTHDQDEAFAFADKVGVMREGEIEQWGAAEILYHQPATAFVADFIGEGTVLDRQFEEERQCLQDLGCSDQLEGFVLLRPNQVRLKASGGGLQAQLQSCVYRAGQYLACAGLPGGKELLFYTEYNLSAQIGKDVFLGLSSNESVSDRILVI